MWPCKNCIHYLMVNLYRVKKDDPLAHNSFSTRVKKDLAELEEEDGCELGREEIPGRQMESGEELRLDRI